MAQVILLSINELLSYLVNQIPHLDRLISQVDIKVKFDSSRVDSLYPDWFPIFSIL